MNVFLWIYVLVINGAYARDICTPSAVLEELGSVRRGVTKSIPINADLSAHMEIADTLDDKIDEMQEIKETYLDEEEYSKEVIYNNMVFKVVTSTLPAARESCSDLGQGFDVLFARFGEIDWDVFQWAGVYMKKNFGVDVLPIGAVKTSRGIETLTGGWVDEHQGTISSGEKDKYETLLVVLNTEDFSVVAQDVKTVEGTLTTIRPETVTYKVLCCRPAMYHELSNANFHYMDNMVDELEENVEIGEEALKKRALEYKGKPKTENFNSGKVVKVQPSKMLIDVFNGIGKLSSENGWKSGTLNSNFLQTLNEKSKSFSKSDFAAGFKGLLSPKERSYLESGANIIGKIADTVVTFIGEKSTSLKDVYTGSLQVQTSSDDNIYHVYKLKTMVLNRKIVKNRYLIKTNDLAFTSNELREVFGSCPIIPSKSPEKVCQFSPTFSVENQKCAAAILAGKPLDSCDLEYTNEARAVRTNCDKGTNAIISTPGKVTVTMVCNGKQNKQMEFPQGTHKLNSGCAMKLGRTKLLHENKADENQVPPMAIPKEEEFLEAGDTNDLIIVTIIGMSTLVVGLNVILVIVYIRSKCKKNTEHCNSADDIESEEEERSGMIEQDHQNIFERLEKLERKHSNRY